MNIAHFLNAKTELLLDNSFLLYLLLSIINWILQDRISVVLICFEFASLLEILIVGINRIFAKNKYHLNFLS